MPTLKKKLRDLRYRLFYGLLLCRRFELMTLGAPDSIWLSDLRRRFGAAAPDVLEAYRSASGVINEVVAAHLADPNMYIWPEINPGGLVDAYREDFLSCACASEGMLDVIGFDPWPQFVDFIVERCALRAERAATNAPARSTLNAQRSTNGQPARHRRWNETTQIPRGGICQ